ncbi:MAG: hypothetical protein CM1200mP2_37780 [Planctomycetaceae bacterium]|nr:MAG: hypothetical protein CM1200mP2_37780 [Planctomycetaceae bacterium]
MSGGLSQLESWDPKPKTNTGGPFRAIPTSVPGIPLSELLSRTAKHMDKLALVRGINTRNGDHGKGNYHMQTVGRRCRGVVADPGAVCAKGPLRIREPMPGTFVSVGGGEERFGLSRPVTPDRCQWQTAANSERPKDSARRPTSCGTVSVARPTTGCPASSHRRDDAYTYSYERALQLMERRDVFEFRRSRRRCTSSTGKSRLGSGA